MPKDSLRHHLSDFLLGKRSFAPFLPTRISGEDRDELLMELF